MRYVLLLLVPAAAAVATIVRPVAETPVSAERSSLAFARYATVQREVPSTPTVNAAFRFRNRSGDPVTIKSLTPSCGCLRVGVVLGEGGEPRRPPVTVPADGTGLVVATFETTQETPGPHEYTIDVRTAEGVQPRPLSYHVTLPARKVTVQPVPLLFYQAGDEELSQTLTVFDSRDSPLRVTAAEPESEFLRTEVVALPDGHRTEVTVRLVGELPRGTRTEFLTVATDAEGYEEIRVPVVLSGVRLNAARSDAPAGGASEGASGGGG